MFPCWAFAHIVSEIHAHCCPLSCDVGPLLGATQCLHPAFDGRGACLTCLFIRSGRLSEKPEWLCASRANARRGWWSCLTLHRPGGVRAHACVCQGNPGTMTRWRRAVTASRARSHCCSPGTASRLCWMCSGYPPSRALRMTAASPWASASRPCPSRTTSRTGVTRWSRANQLYPRPCWPASQVRAPALFTKGVSHWTTSRWRSRFNACGVILKLSHLPASERGHLDRDVCGRRAQRSG